MCPEIETLLVSDTRETFRKLSWQVLMTDYIKKVMKKKELKMTSWLFDNWLEVGAFHSMENTQGSSIQV